MCIVLSKVATYVIYFKKIFIISIMVLVLLLCDSLTKYFSCLLNYGNIVISYAYFYNLVCMVGYSL